MQEILLKKEYIYSGDLIEENTLRKTHFLKSGKIPDLSLYNTATFT